MKINKISLLLAATVFATPLVSYAQSAPQAASVVSQAPGKIGEADAIQFQGKVKSIDKKARTVTVVGPQGNQIVIQAGEIQTGQRQTRTGLRIAQPFLQQLRCRRAY